MLFQPSSLCPCPTQFTHGEGQLVLSTVSYSFRLVLRTQPTKIPTSHDESRSKSHHLQLHSTRWLSGKTFIHFPIYLALHIIQNLSRAISTHGRGGAGVVETPGPDPLFSQDSVKVSGSFLYAVNVSTLFSLVLQLPNRSQAGSNTVSMFKISRNDPTVLWMVGNPIGSEGEFPVAVAASEARNMVCVLNGGAVNGVSCVAG